MFQHSSPCVDSQNSIEDEFSFGYGEYDGNGSAYEDATTGFGDGTAADYLPPDGNGRGNGYGTGRGNGYSPVDLAQNK
jgi:hypothetical protein